MARRRSKRDHEREPFWRQIIGQWQASCQSVTPFCRERGISEGGFYAWRKRLAGNIGLLGLSRDRFGIAVARQLLYSASIQGKPPYERERR